VGLYPGHKGDKGVRRIALNIEFCGEQRLQQLHIAVSDMALVGPGVDGNALGPELLTIDRHLLHIGDISAPGIAESGNLIDIYA
jgi:hypothetical protein